MNDRMNKTELLELIKSLKISKSEFWVLSSGALVLREIFPDAGDLDIAVTDKGLEELKANYDLKEKGNDFYYVCDNVECVCDGPMENLKYQPEKIGEYYVQNIEEYYEYLKGSSREKDKARIGLVEQYMSIKKK